MMHFLKKNWQTIVIILIIIIAIISNFFFFKLAINFIIVFFCLIALLFKRQKDFLREWYLPLSLFYIYEFTRAKAYDFSVLIHRPLLDSFIIGIDRKLFEIGDQIPSVFLQYSLSNIETGKFVPGWLDYILFFFYSSFFWFWILTAALAWKEGKIFFQKYIYGILAFSLLDNLIFAFFPSAPPWYASQIGLLPPIERLMITYDYFFANNFTLMQNYGGNLFAAFPSHHAAWSFFAALFIVYMYGKRALPIFIVPLMIIFATWYGAEHYVIDSLVGCMIAGITFMLVRIDYKQVFKKGSV